MLEKIPLCVSTIFIVILCSFLPAIVHAGCPEGKFLYQGRCVWESEISCPDGEQFDRVLLRCRSCESFRKIWDPRTKTCGCEPCQVEVEGSCRPCYEDGMACVRGECVETAESRKRQDSWRDPPETFFHDFATSISEVKGRRKSFVVAVKDTEAQVGERIDRGFAYCTCKGEKGLIVWAQAMGKLSVRDLEKRTEAAAQNYCGGCITPPVIDLLNEF